METDKKLITFDNVILQKVLNFGALKYGPYKICKLLGLDIMQTEEFIQQFNIPESELRIKYEQGVSIGDYNLDAELAKQGERGDVFAITTLGTRQYHRKMDDMKKELFDI